MLLAEGPSCEAQGEKHCCTPHLNHSAVSQKGVTLMLDRRGANFLEGFSST